MFGENFGQAFNGEEEAQIRKLICDEAQSWIGTPYHDHAGVKGAGVDCAFFPYHVYRALGLVEAVKIPYYSPQQWLNSPSQRDRMKLRVVDTTYLDIVLKLTKREITEEEVKPGDFVIVKIVASWTHGGIVIRKWSADDPGYILHPVKGRGVMGSGINEGFWADREKRFFTVI